MQINDETLSAFLDHELSATEMANVREAVGRDSIIAARLAELASADARLKQYAAMIDELPLPTSVTQLFEESGSDTVTDTPAIPVPLWRSSQRFLQQHKAGAAVFLLVLTISAGYFSTFLRDPAAAAAQVYALLESSPSGELVSMDTDTSWLSSFSFRNPQGDYCRHYLLRTASGSSENIACKHAGNWQVLASAPATVPQVLTGYRPASGSSALDSMLDSLMTAPALSVEEEAALISTKWQPAEPR